MDSLTYLIMAAVAALLGFVLPEPLALVSNVVGMIMVGIYTYMMVTSRAPRPEQPRAAQPRVRSRLPEQQRPVRSLS